MKNWCGYVPGYVVCMCGWIVGSRYADMLCYLVEPLGRQEPRPIAGKPSQRCSSNTVPRSDLARDLGLLGIQANLRAHTHKWIYPKCMRYV